MAELQPGLVGESTLVVTEALTAASFGSGLVPAFSTPALVGLMEGAAFDATKLYLDVGQTSVGIEVNIKHMAATPVGMRVRARAVLTRVEGRRLDFNVEAWDEVEKIGEGTHARMVVDSARFNAKFNAKIEQAARK